MGYVLNTETGKMFLEQLQKEYDVYAPKLYQGEGCFSDTDVVRYGKIDSLEEIVWDKKSDYSFKEVLLPISDTIMYFTEDSTKIPDESRPRLIFLRSCELHALQRLDEIYLQNGPEDYYYKRIREKARFVLMGCSQSYESCFCVSMGTNISESYDLYMHCGVEGIYAEICDPSLESLVREIDLESGEQEHRYVTENDISVELPRSLPDDIAHHELWKEYAGRCIGCGRCNFVCPTCTCFTMQDIFYKDNEQAGERRRVWASCQVDGFTDMAGGISFRKDQGERMRFKVLHKIQNHGKRFGHTMCVGCGRCENVCPEYISYIGCLEKLNKLEKEEA